MLQMQSKVYWNNNHIKVYCNNNHIKLYFKNQNVLKNNYKSKVLIN
jgi:hypothetical protein